MDLHRVWIWSVAITMVALPVLAEEPAEEQEKSPWAASLGLSYVATSGNTDTSSFGLDFEIKREPQPWGLTASFKANRAEEDSRTTAERFIAAARAERSLSTKWSLFGGISGEQDRFKGIDMRTIVEAGGAFKAVENERHTLSFDAGLTWTRDDVYHGDATDSTGSLLGLAYTFQISETSELSQRLVYYPNFDESDDWRYVSETALKANVNSRLALKLGYQISYDNLPVEGFDKRDSTSSASIVLSF